jgi:prepilin-type N-terminal cleavage/methylation domain-containing protein
LIGDELEILNPVRLHRMEKDSTTMISRITRSLMKRRSALQEGDAGFTLIELLVVVLIIGLLAAIAIPIFVSQQNGAKDAAVKSDLGTAKTAEVSYGTQNNGTYTTDPTALATYGFTATAGTSATTIKLVGTTGFCIQETSAAANTFHMSDSSGVATGACP